MFTSQKQKEIVQLKEVNDIWPIRPKRLDGSNIMPLIEHRFMICVLIYHNIGFMR